MATILQFSDPHLLSEPQATLKGVPTARCLQRVLQHAQEHFTTPDRIVVTGDLSHDHSVAGYQRLKSLLGPWSQRALLVPGNHDDREGLRSTFAQVPGQPGQDCWFCETLDDWQLIGLDTQVPGQVFGQLSDAMLERLRHELEANPRRPTLIFLHHHPIPVDSAWIDELGLRNADALARELQGQAVRGIFCGHVHQEFAGQLAGVPVYSTPSVAIQFQPRRAQPHFDLLPPGYRVIRLQGNTIETHVMRLDTITYRPIDTSR